MRGAIGPGHGGSSFLSVGVLGGSGVFAEGGGDSGRGGTFGGGGV